MSCRKSMEHSKSFLNLNLIHRLYIQICETCLLNSFSAPSNCVLSSAVTAESLWRETPVYLFEAVGYDQTSHHEIMYKSSRMLSHAILYDWMLSQGGNVPTQNAFLTTRKPIKRMTLRKFSKTQSLVSNHFDSIYYIYLILKNPGIFMVASNTQAVHPQAPTPCGHWSVGSRRLRTPRPWFKAEKSPAGGRAMAAIWDRMNHRCHREKWDIWNMIFLFFCWQFFWGHMKHVGSVRIVGYNGIFRII